MVMTSFRMHPCSASMFANFVPMPDCPIRRTSALNDQTFRFIQTAFGSVKFSIAAVPCSRPKPESRTPPHGNRTSVYP